MKEITQITKNLGGLISKNSPHILTGLGCAGVLSTAILAVKATPTAIELIVHEETYRERKRMNPLSNFDKIKLTWHCYVPTGIVGVATIGCIIGANTVNMRRNAALASLYAVSETAFREFKTKAVEEIGKAKVTKIQDDIARDHLIQNPLQQGNVIFTGNGDVLCYDKMSGRYFTSSYETIRQKVNDLNFRLRNEMRIELNELYYELNLPDIELGHLMEFNIEKGEGKINPHYSTQLSEDGKPCLVIDFEVFPMYMD